MLTPAEEVPTHLQGATAAAEFLANATKKARTAFEGRQVTRLVDKAGTAEGGISAVSLRRVMQQNEDLLAQLPAVRQKLDRLATSYEARAKVEASPLGRIARSPHVRAALDALFPW